MLHLARSVVILIFGDFFPDLRYVLHSCFWLTLKCSDSWYWVVFIPLGFFAGCK